MRKIKVNVIKRCCNIPEEKLFRVYPIIGLILGMIFSLLIPIRTVPDETFHVAQAYEVSNKILGTSGGNENIVMRNDDRTHYLQYKPYSKAQFKAYWASLNDPLKDSKMVRFGIPVTGHAYPYFIAGIGIAAGRLLKTGTGITLSLGRLFNLIFFVICGTITLRVIPFAKRLMFLLLLMPMTVQQGMSYSYDVLVIAVSFLSIALFLRLNYDDTISIKKQKAGTIILFVLALLLAPIKSHAYILFMFLPVYTLMHFIAGDRKEKIWKIFWNVVKILVAAFIVLWFVAWRVPEFIPEKANYIAWAKADGYSITVLLHHPVRTIVVMVGSLIQFWEYHFVETLIGGSLGSLLVNLPGIFKITFLFMILLASFRAQSSDIKLRKKTKIVFFWVALLTVICIAVGMLISWTPLSSNVILGIQGRYYIPVIFMFLILLNNDEIRVSDRIQSVLPSIAIVTDLAAAAYIYLSAV